MPSGDAQRVWFPEMIEELKTAWSSSMTWGELADFCERMTEKRRAIREARGILPPRTRCPRCGAVSRSDIRGVSVRSALFALMKIGAIAQAEFKDLDRSWKKHRTKQALDPYGRKVETCQGDVEDRSSCC